MTGSFGGLAPAAGKGQEERRRAALAALAPGTELRDGLERILRGSTGALIVLGYDPAVAGLCSGGFELNVEFSPTRLRELAKMDGAIVLDTGARTIVRAAVQLVPDPGVPTEESGTRHRTAERVARQTGYPVISVSKSMRIITLFIDGTRFVLEDSAALLSQANQALATLERYKRRLDEVSGALSALEIEDQLLPRRVEHHVGIEHLVPTEFMVEKVKAAVAAPRSAYSMRNATARRARVAPSVLRITES